MVGPAVAVPMSTSPIQWVFELWDAGADCRDVPYTVVLLLLAAYCVARLAPRPRVAPTMRTVDIVAAVFPFFAVCASPFGQGYVLFRALRIVVCLMNEVLFEIRMVGDNWKQKHDMTTIGDMQVVRR
jgi:hypothetical protein